jgi:branched-chain amino acid aminotransferase
VIEQIGVQERACPLEELLAADEAFLASTTREVQPVSAVDDTQFDAPGPVTSRIASEVAEVIRSELDREQ